MRIISTLFITLLFGLFISSCSNDDNNEATTLRVSSLALLFNSNDTDAKEILITTDAGSWKAEKSENWVTITPQVHERRLLINVSEYKIGKTTREATVTVTANGVDPVVIKVTQAPIEFEGLTLMTDTKLVTFEVEAGGASFPVEVITNLESYEIVCNQDWIKYEIDPDNKNIIHLTATKGNKHAVDRKAVLVLSGNKVDNAVVEIVQKGLKIELDQEELEFGPNGKTQTVKVTTNLKEFSVKGSEEWVKCEIDENDKTLVHISAAADGLVEPRQAKAIITPVGVTDANFEIPILQKGIIFKVSKTFFTFKKPIEVESGSFTVEANFDWEIVQEEGTESWFSAIRDENDNTIVNVNTFKAYTSTLHQSELHISAIDVDVDDLKVKIVQEALLFKISSPTLGVLNLRNTGAAQSGYIQTALGDDDWTYESPEAWITVTRFATNPKRLVISATANDSTEVRSGTVVMTAINDYAGVGSIFFVINQAGTPAP